MTDHELISFLKPWLRELMVLKVNHVKDLGAGRNITAVGYGRPYNGELSEPVAFLEEGFAFREDKWGPLELAICLSSPMDAVDQQLVKDALDTIGRDIQSRIEPDHTQVKILRVDAYDRMCVVEYSLVSAQGPGQ